MKIPERFYPEAERLAARPYFCYAVPDGDMYMAYAPALKGCHAQGHTPGEALIELAGARIDYIASLLMDGLPVPEP